MVRTRNAPQLSRASATYALAVQDLPQVLEPAWGAITHYAGRMGVQPSGPPFVAYHNKDALLVKATLFSAVTQAEARAVEAAADRYGRFLGMPALPAFE